MNPKLEQLRKRYVNPSPSPDASGVYTLGPRSSGGAVSRCRLVIEGNREPVARADSALESAKTPLPPENLIQDDARLAVW
jgi:hypothetical protein